MLFAEVIYVLYTTEDSQLEFIWVTVYMLKYDTYFYTHTHTHTAAHVCVFSGIPGNTWRLKSDLNISVKQAEIPHSLTGLLFLFFFYRAAF